MAAPCSLHPTPRTPPWTFPELAPWRPAELLPAVFLLSVQFSCAPRYSSPSSPQPPVSPMAEASSSSSSAPSPIVFFPAGKLCERHHASLVLASSQLGLRPPLLVPHGARPPAAVRPARVLGWSGRRRLRPVSFPGPPRCPFPCACARVPAL
ncbi:uncharacterized protein LOC100304234 [Zea mays]|uniref:Uncharacterized protein n=1 Tax=Zea mays TaxID=4577 RepID=C0HDY4_MAIZE|nr:uncharacterized protein LOC100304234 [Zea mays]ACN25237.1 unknown [Zea mays]ACN25414.1 unknown [Zea mays]|eukprot:NP_001159151.1 uncharacterized protein LOC100304234 [Zea mays]